MSTRADIVEAILRLKPRDGIFSVEAICRLTYSDYGITPTLSDEEYISKFRRSLFTDIFSKQDKLIAAGGLKTFDVSSIKDLKLSWARSHQMGRKHRQRLNCRASVARWLHGLDDRSYEIASAYAMKSLGASKVHVTPKGDEFGMDFLALVPAFTKSPLFVSGARGVRIVGQSKKYSHPVAREKIQSFNDLIGSIKNNKAELIPLLPSWFRSSGSPIISCFIAHSGYQAGSIRMSSQAGHILIDSIGLAEIIGRPSRFGDDGEDGVTHKALWSEINRIAT
ncbi:restriction endonuclease [Sphingobium lactosutens]|jgi:hypothetical protein|uniref:restriction endonuclease n=1 Tax=Sphingobium lactosutens TaxID=522773 RepID=UPI000C3F12B5|nr:restriction endonuclease [Sphingobium lactosutens]MBA37907.1 hypothetical protein [Sphingobium sp.]MBS48242.1 hypothetical protein [Sphingobium sp.]MCC4256973.1 restriction endonuclease [Sphingobium lactosutens]HCW61845.1 hypothetical protein [Sphingobium sp.]|tara:strand:+ start:2946 stop:3785 length:840 start_codon:yes stop_codon:yes gene_type:complete